EPLRPASDDEIVETLPTLGGFAREQREMRRKLAQQPRDAATALALSRSTLARARIEGDARLAGQALGVLGAWEGDADAPVEIRLQRATLRQHLHEFDAAVKELQAVLRTAPRHPQALLTLATIHRVQGRYAESDAACEQLNAAGQPLYARACLAENQALRGDIAAARSEFEALLKAQPADAGWASWIRTSLGELEQRAGRPEAAIAQLRAAQEAGADPYSRLALADVLIEAERWPEAQVLLVDAGDSEAALLRRAIVERALRSDAASELQHALAARYTQAALRPEAAAVHARERARFALEVEGEPERAVALARANLQTQREAIDLVVMHRAARAASDAAAQAEVTALAERIGLHDARMGAKGSTS
ncbi:MAG: hypothetical protein H0W48_11720, partial [Methylibium sp.]|nr:hypothetical protein [Methylibium sp.]